MEIDIRTQEKEEYSLKELYSAFQGILLYIDLDDEEIIQSNLHLPANGKSLFQKQIQFLEKSGIYKIYIICYEEDKDKFIEGLNIGLGHKGKASIEFVGVKKEIDFTTMMNDFYKDRKITKDFLIMLGNATCDINLNNLEEVFLQQKSLITLCLQPQTPQAKTEEMSIYGMELEKDVYFMHKKARLFYLQAALDFKQDARIPKVFLKGHPNIVLCSDLQDSGIYVCRFPLLRLIVRMEEKEEIMNSLQRDFIPWLIKDQYSPLLKSYLEDYFLPHNDLEQKTYALYNNSPLDPEDPLQIWTYLP